MIYGQHLTDGVIAGQTAKLEVGHTKHKPSLLTRVLAHHEGNIVHVAQTLFTPGQVRDEHVNEDVDELLIVLNGVLEVRSNAETTLLKAEDGGYIFLPHGVTQSIANPTGDEAILLTVAIRHENFVHRNQTLRD